ncbi:MAG: GNAT family N-acetyltransferase [Nitrososphaeraceae archaeon]
MEYSHTKNNKIENNKNIKIRELKDSDLNNGFFDTLENLSNVQDIKKNQNMGYKILKEILENKNLFVFVALENNIIVGSITIIIEQKFIHNGGMVGHIEDVVTRKGFEDKGIGTKLVKNALKFAERKKCYKVILNCSKENTGFYKKNRFVVHGIEMRYDINKKKTE